MAEGSVGQAHDRRARPGCPCAQTAANQSFQPGALAHSGDLQAGEAVNAQGTTPAVSVHALGQPMVLAASPSTARAGATRHKPRTAAPELRALGSARPQRPVPRGGLEN